jgi:hypothetical protein
MIMMQTITYEEQQLMSIYAHGTRLELIEALNDMRTYLDQDEQELKDLTDSAIAKLNAMTDEEFSELDLIPDFG